MSQIIFANLITGGGGGGGMAKMTYTCALLVALVTLTFDLWTRHVQQIGRGPVSLTIGQMVMVSDTRQGIGIAKMPDTCAILLTPVTLTFDLWTQKLQEIVRGPLSLRITY